MFTLLLLGALCKTMVHAFKIQIICSSFFSKLLSSLINILAKLLPKQQGYIFVTHRILFTFKYDFILCQVLHQKQWRQNEFESGGKTTCPAQNAGKFCMWCPSTFLAVQVQLVVLVSAFVVGQYSLVTFSFAVLLLPVPHGVDDTAQSFIKRIVALL